MHLLSPVDLVVTVIFTCIESQVPPLPEDYKPKVTADGKEKKGYSDLEGRVNENVQRVRRSDTLYCHFCLDFLLYLLLQASLE